MAAYTNYLRNKLVDWLLRGQTFTPPATLHVALLICTRGTVNRSTAYALNDTVTVVTQTGRNQLYKCTTAGTTAASAPGYTGASAESVSDGTAVFAEQSVALAAGTAQAEPQGGNYARVAVGSTLANWAGTQGAGSTAASTGTGTSGTTSNNGLITFPIPTASWTGIGQVWGFGLYDAATAGNCLIFAGSTNGAKSINLGDLAPSFAAAALLHTVDA